MRVLAGRAGFRDRLGSDVVAGYGCRRAGRRSADGGTEKPNSTVAADRRGSSVILPVVGQPVRKGDLVLRSSPPARCAPTAWRSSARDGRNVTAVPVHPGQAVKQGQVIVTRSSIPRELDSRGRRRPRPRSKRRSSSPRTNIGPARCVVQTGDRRAPPEPPRDPRRLSGRGEGRSRKAKLQQRGALDRAHRSNGVPPLDAVKVCRSGEPAREGQDVGPDRRIGQSSDRGLGPGTRYPYIKIGGEAIITDAGGCPDRNDQSASAAILPMSNKRGPSTGRAV